MTKAAALESLALSNAQALHNLLGDLYDLPQHGERSCVEQAWNLMDVVIWYLDPHGPDNPPTRRRTSYGLNAGVQWPAIEMDDGPNVRDRGEIRLMLEAGVSIPDCASYFGASEAAIRHLIGESQRVGP
jgi:hypothetical protein